MAIKIVEDGPELTLTRSEHSRLLDEYQRQYMFYAGIVPTFEEWVRAKKGSVNEVTTSKGLLRED